MIREECIGGEKHEALSRRAPEFCAAAVKTKLPVAHMIYKIGRGYHLYRAEIQGQIRGG
jgi:hypothetical protein